MSSDWGRLDDLGLIHFGAVEAVDGLRKGKVRSFVCVCARGGVPEKGKGREGIAAILRLLSRPLHTRNPPRCLPNNLASQQPRRNRVGGRELIACAVPPLRVSSYVSVSVSPNSYKWTPPMQGEQRSACSGPSTTLVTSLRTVAQ